ncbi:MAG: GlsB/YeaQ/YmgE family stress response membrane protein [Rhodobacterales bacterium]|nr:MAG: GlsB/YeaQ/YmgE family stress response membrane protein [Rhodobacterales bacterium]
MEGFGFLASIIIGGLAGWIGSRIMESRNGLIVNILLGVIGATVANWLLGKAGFSAEPDLIPQFITAVLGAILLIWIARALRR